MISFVDLDFWLHQKQQHNNTQSILIPSDTTAVQLPIWIQKQCDCIKCDQVARPRVKRVQEALAWLQQNNPLYSRATVNEAAFKEMELLRYYFICLMQISLLIVFLL